MKRAARAALANAKTARDRRKRNRVVTLTGPHSRFVEAFAKRGILGTDTQEVVNYLLARAISDIVGSGFVAKLEETKRALRASGSSGGADELPAPGVDDYGRHQRKKSAL